MTIDLNLLKSPGKLSKLVQDGDFLKSADGDSYALQSGVPILLTQEIKKYVETFDLKYTSQNEPWDYSRRAIEQVRHVYVAAKAKKLIGDGKRILDIGCALGQLTHRLKNICSEVWAIDISPTAAVKVQKLLLEKSQWEGFKVAAASASDLPFSDQSFRVVLLSDGLVGWEFSEALQMAALKEAYRVLEPGGYAILTDYLNPRDFEKHKNNVLKGPFQFVESEFLGDRIGFQIANNFKKISGLWPIKALLGSLRFNSFLCDISKPFGPSMSKHMSIILQKPK